MDFSEHGVRWKNTEYLRGYKKIFVCATIL